MDIEKFKNENINNNNEFQLNYLPKKILVYYPLVYKQKHKTQTKCTREITRFEFKTNAKFFLQML